MSFAMQPILSLNLFDWKLWPSLYYLLIDAFGFSSIFDEKNILSLRVRNNHCVRVEISSEKWVIWHFTLGGMLSSMLDQQQHHHCTFTLSHLQRTWISVQIFSVRFFSLDSLFQNTNTIQALIFISLRMPLTFHVQITNIPRIWKLFCSCICAAFYLFRLRYWLDCLFILYISAKTANGATENACQLLNRILWFLRFCASMSAMRWYVWTSCDFQSVLLWFCRQSATPKRLNYNYRKFWFPALEHTFLSKLFTKSNSAKCVSFLAVSFIGK